LKIYLTYIKSVGDLLVGMLAFLILSPVFLLVAILLALSFQGNPFFVQPRIGKDNKVFHVIKFRTMSEKRGAGGELLPDDQRLTTLGRIIRSSSLDEIPQLINILKREMSFVGPRPLLVEYLPLYSPEQARRHHVLPGITGWAQINGRNSISWKSKFEYDVWYVDHAGFFLDIKILFVTVMKVLKAEGISGRGVVTAEKFNGKN
jgi:undecaprenyl phosphate N,N'-diacetylbacillosamine 1-phosphate transferase